MAVQAETGESASDSGIKQVEVEPAPPISEVTIPRMHDPLLRCITLLVEFLS